MNNRYCIRTGRLPLCIIRIHSHLRSNIRAQAELNRRFYHSTKGLNKGCSR